MLRQDRQTDRPTDKGQTVTLRLPLDAAIVKKAKIAKFIPSYSSLPVPDSFTVIIRYSISYRFVVVFIVSNSLSIMKILYEAKERSSRVLL